MPHMLLCGQFHGNSRADFTAALLCRKRENQPSLDCRKIQQKAEQPCYFTDRALNSRLGLFG